MGNNDLLNGSHARSLLVKKLSDGSVVPNCLCVQIVMNDGAEPSTCSLVFPTRPWDYRGGLSIGDGIRVVADNGRVLFIGVITAWNPKFTADNESSEFFCQCPKYVYSAQQVAFGQYHYSIADYDGADWSSGVADPTGDYGTFATAWRCIFNENKLGNRAKATINFSSPQGTWTDYNFSYLDGERWTVRQMVVYLLNKVGNIDSEFVPDEEPYNIVPKGDEWSYEPNHVNVDCMRLIEAIQYVVNRIGWAYTMEWDAAGSLHHVFYKPGTTEGNRTRRKITLSSPRGDTAMPRLRAGDEHRIVAGNLLFDASAVVNRSITIGGIPEYEITVELRPGWAAGAPSVEGIAVDQIHWTDDQIQTVLDAGGSINSYAMLKKYYPSGSDFSANHQVGRLWVLNESGAFSKTGVARGGPFDLATFLGLDPEDYIYRPRIVLDNITALNRQPYPITIEFSLDGGASWHLLNNWRLEPLKDQWGIYLGEPNLGNVKPMSGGGHWGDAFNSLEKNYFTGICKDAALAWAPMPAEGEPAPTEPQWGTRVRLTATIQSDLRLYRDVAISNSGTRLTQMKVYDRNEAFGYRARTDSSVLPSALPTLSIDDRAVMDEQMAEIDKINKIRQYAGSFSFGRIYTDMRVGDLIATINGRNVDLNNGGRYPWIKQIIMSPQIQEQTIVLTDKRTSRIG